MTALAMGLGLVLGLFVGFLVGIEVGCQWTMESVLNTLRKKKPTP